MACPATYPSSPSPSPLSSHHHTPPTTITTTTRRSTHTGIRQAENMTTKCMQVGCYRHYTSHNAIQPRHKVAWWHEHAGEGGEGKWEGGKGGRWQAGCVCGGSAGGAVRVCVCRKRRVDQRSPLIIIHRIKGKGQGQRRKGRVWCGRWQRQEDKAWAMFHNGLMPGMPEACPGEPTVPASPCSTPPFPSILLNLRSCKSYYYFIMRIYYLLYIFIESD